ncbi:MAG: WcbI family polysaccharide biosynthesis putative acetyltransferase, partial [Pseudomonadota bacterium]
NSNRVRKFDTERSKQLLEEAEHIVTQPVMNKDNDDYYENLQEKYGDKLTFMPYIWLDGLTSMVRSPGASVKGREVMLGQEYIVKQLDQYGLWDTLRRFRQNNIEFEHVKRFERSLGELKRREQSCHVTVSDFIEAHYRDRPVMLTHNHPHPDAICHIAGQIADRLNLKWAYIGRDNPRRLAAITLAEFDKVFSPYCAEEHGMTYDWDIQWWEKGNRLISELDAFLKGKQEMASPA